MSLNITSELKQALAPLGTIRASINVGNPILANLDENNQPYGISIDLAKRLAELIGTTLELIVHTSAGKSVDCVLNNEADFGFFAVDPVRGKDIEFTNPYVLIEGTYVVHNDSPVKTNDDVDHPGTTVMVGKGSAYDLYLSRNIKHAQLLRSPTSPEVVEYFLKENADVCAGVKPQLQNILQNHPELRMLPESFMQIRQAMGLRKDRGTEAAEFIKNFVDNAINTGFVKDLAEKHAMKGATAVTKL